MYSPLCSEGNALTEEQITALLEKTPSPCSCFQIIISFIEMRQHYICNRTLSPMNNIISILLALIGPLTLLSCSSSKNESNLNSNEIKFIQKLVDLNKNETIELFESNGGLKGLEQSGNLITPNRIVSYWIEEDQKDIKSALFMNEIDSITLTDLTSNPTYSSYLTIFKTDGSNFNVYVDADITRTYNFYHSAHNNWLKYRMNK